MLKNIIIFYFAENKIYGYIKKKEKEITTTLSKNILKNGKIIHHPKFYKEFSFFIKKNKLIHKFQKNEIYVIVPPIFEEIDKELLQTIMEDLLVDKLTIIKETKLYQLKKGTLWINKNESYAYLTYQDKKKIKSDVWNKSYLLNFPEYVNLYLHQNPSIKKVIFIGTDPHIAKYTNEIEKKTKKIIFYFEDAQNYLISQFLKHNLR